MVEVAEKNVAAIEEAWRAMHTIQYGELSKPGIDAQIDLLRYNANLAGMTLADFNTSEEELAIFKRTARD